MIELNKVCKSFKGKKVIKDFSLCIKEGEFVAITGASGTGKTTILNLIGGLIFPDEGEISVLSIKNPTNKAFQILRRDKLGYIFQNFVLMDNETVLENLKISKMYNPEWSIDLAKTYLELVGLNEAYLHKKIYELSGGEQQRVSIVRLLLKKCSIALADEPTGNLDRTNKIIIIDVFKKMKKQGKTIICVTHDEEVALAADRIVEIKALA